MTLNTSQDAIIALIGTLFGGATLEVVRRALTKSKEKEDSATAMRSELRVELGALKTEMQTIDNELDVWKQKYYELYENYVLMKVQYNAAVAQLVKAGLSINEVILPNTPLDKSKGGAVESDGK